MRAAKPIALEPDEIEDIYIKGVRDDDGRVITKTEITKNRISSSRFFFLLVSGVGSIVPAIIFSFLASSSDFSDETMTTTQEAIFAVTFYSTVFFIPIMVINFGKTWMTD